MQRHCQHCLCILRDERACLAREAICSDNSGKPATTDSRCHLDCKSALELHRHQRNGVTRCQHACRHCPQTLSNVPESKAHELYQQSGDHPHMLGVYAFTFFHHHARPAQALAAPALEENPRMRDQAQHSLVEQGSVTTSTCTKARHQLHNVPDKALSP